jgi:hypothetical protein
MKKKNINEDVLTGADIAEMFGLSDIYQQGKEQIAREQQMTGQVRSQFNNMNDRMNNVPKGMDTYE